MLEEFRETYSPNAENQILKVGNINGYKLNNERDTMINKMDDDTAMQLIWEAERSIISCKNTIEKCNQEISNKEKLIAMLQEFISDQG